MENGGFRSTLFLFDYLYPEPSDPSVEVRLARNLLVVRAVRPGVVEPELARIALDRGLLINAPRPDTLRFMPALDVTRDEIDQMLELLEGVLRET